MVFITFQLAKLMENLTTFAAQTIAARTMTTITTIATMAIEKPTTTIMAEARRVFSRGASLPTGSGCGSRCGSRFVSGLAP